MSVSTRAKFVCKSVEDFGQSKQVKLSAVYGLPQDGPPSEDNRFTKATPWGEIAMAIDNPAAAVQFVPGKYYYVDFTQAPEMGS